MKGRLAGKRKRRTKSSPTAISLRTMKMIEQSAANLKKGRASAPIDDKERAR
jgi:hypothetical protein